MKITPMAPAPGATAAPPSAAAQARERAVAAFSKGAEPQSPVQNQNAIQPEEMAAIASPSGQKHLEETETDVQITSDEVQETAPKAPEDKPLSEQHLQLIRREKALRAQAQAFQAREKALAEREAKLTQAPAAPDYSNYIPKDQIKQNALQVLADAGVSYDELTQQILDQGSVDPRAQAQQAALQARIDKLEAAIEDGKKASAQQQDDAYKAAVRQIETDVKKLVFTGDDFEMIKVTNSTKDVVELIEATWKESGTLLTNEEAAQQVEDYLIEEAEKLARTNKMKKRLTPAASTQTATTPTQTPGVKQPQQATPQKMTTLTNQNSVSRQMTARERALLAFKGELK